MFDLLFFSFLIFIFTDNNIFAEANVFFFIVWDAFDISLCLSKIFHKQVGIISRQIVEDDRSKFCFFELEITFDMRGSTEFSREMTEQCVIPSGMSDHLPIVATRKYNRTRSNNSRCNAISYRDIKNLNKDAFVESLETAPWDCAFVFDDINDIVDAWYKILKAVVNEHLPLKQKRVKRRNQPKWFNANILKEIRTRDNSLKKARKSNLERDWDLYKRAKHSVSSLIRRTKQRIK